MESKFKVGQKVQFQANPYEATIQKINVIGLVGEVYESPARSLRTNELMHGVVIVKVEVPEEGILYLYANERILEPIENPDDPIALAPEEKAIPEFAEKLERCVQNVKTTKHAVNPYAVCRASLRRKYGLPIKSEKE